MMNLEILWYLVVCISAIAYVVLDGFDLGAGMLHLFTKKDEERRLMLNAIGPVWDGNEVWLVIIGGALFAGFPRAYGVLFSAFYTPFMIFLAGIIFRAAAIEFRSKLESKRWRNTWDILYSLATYIITFILGVLLGNLVVGIPLDKNGVFSASFLIFFSPYPLIMGVTSISLFMMHGAIFLLMKTEGDFHTKLREWTFRSMTFFIISYVSLSMATLTFMPHMLTRMRAMPYLFILGIIAMLLIANIPREINKGHDGRAFLSSIFSMFFLFILFGIGLFPQIVRSSIDTEINSLTLYNSSSSSFTLKILMIIVIIGIPLVLAYGFWIYRIFRGKVKLNSSSY